MSQRRLPAEIYWRRRLLLLAVVIAVVWGVLQVTGGDDEPTAATTPPAATRTPSATAATSSAPPAPEDTTSGAVDVAIASGDTPCDPELVRITPSVRPGQLTRGAVDIGLAVSSTQTTACTLEPGDADAIAVISANGTPVWDSTVCKASLLATPVQLSPEWTTFATVQWTGRGSGSSCASNQGWATAGKYTLQIGTLGGEPGKTTFSLDARPAAPKTPKVPQTPETPPAPAAPGASATPGAPAPSGSPTDPSQDPPVTPAEG